MKKILVIGGAFNPPTNAHRETLMKAMEHIKKYEGSKAVVIPSCVNQTKKWKDSDTNLFTDEDRLKMCELTFNDLPMEVEVLDYEISQGRKGLRTSTYDTLNYIQETYEGYQTIFIMGDDKIDEIDMWYQAKKLFEEYMFMIVRREKTSMENLANINAHNYHNNKENFTLIDNKGIPRYSSTMVRNNIKNGKPIYEMVVNEVNKYIKRRM